VRIGLDGACLSPRPTGVGRYFQGLLRELIPLDPELEYTLFMKGEADPGLRFPNLRTVTLEGGGSYFIWQNTRLRRALRNGEFDRFWSPNYSLPLCLSTPSILTVHDISWRSLPGDYSWAQRWYKNVTAGRGIRRAGIIFTDSDFSRDEIVRHARVAAGKVKRVHLGIDEKFQRAGDDEIAGFKARHGVPGQRLIGFLGSFFKRRHVPEMIAAMEIARRRAPDLVLVLVGENYSVPPALLLSGRPGVLWLERIAEPELNAFYSSLSLFLYPSDYEGFGLPPMEALNCGTPSLLLPRGSLAEVYEGLALFIDRPDPALIAEAIAGYLQREEETRQRLLDRWRERKPYFSWKRAAAECLGEIRQAPCPS